MALKASNLCRGHNLLRRIPSDVRAAVTSRIVSQRPGVVAQASPMATAAAPEAPAAQTASAKKRVVFVVGGPGSGKGTQCDMLARDFGVPFFSAGELIRSLIASGCPEGKQLQEIILQGQIIPSEVTVGLLQKAMATTTSDTVLIDGFPRNHENRTVWASQVGYDCEMVLLFDCPDEVMLQRLLGRAGQGSRADDNEETIKKRVKNFKSQMEPVLEHYRGIGKVTTIRTDRPIPEVYAEVSGIWRQRFANVTAA